jgi:hypothetical protein
MNAGFEPELEFGEILIMLLSPKKRIRIKPPFSHVDEHGRKLCAINPFLIKRAQFIL